MVSSVLGDEPALTGQHAYGAVCMGTGTDFEEVPGVIGRKRDGFPTVVEIIVQVFDFLIASEEIHRSCTRCGGKHVVPVRLYQFVRNVRWNMNLVHRDHFVITGQ